MVSKNLHAEQLNLRLVIVALRINVASTAIVAGFELKPYRWRLWGFAVDSVPVPAVLNVMPLLLSCFGHGLVALRLICWDSTSQLKQD